MIFLKSLLFLLGQIVSTFLLGPLVLMLWPFPMQSRYRLAVLWTRFNLWMLKVICGLGFEVKGTHHIPKDQAGLIFCKHQSAFETLALLVIFPPSVFILKQELIRIPVWGWALSTLKPIAIDRSAKSQALKQVLREGVARIRSGYWVILFPEGTRVAPGEKGHYGSSGGLLAHSAQCPVVPVAHNAGTYWRKNGFLKYPGTIQVVIGPALDGATLSAAEITREGEAWIEETMASLPH